MTTQQIRPLRKKEQAVLATLQGSAGKVVSRDELAGAMSNPEAARKDSRAIDMTISRIRKARPDVVIHTAYGAGYLLRVTVAKPQSI